MKDDIGREVRLIEQWKDATLLILYFLSTFGFICKLEMLTFTAMHRTFLEADDRIFGVSNDSLRSLGAYSESLKISFPCSATTRPCR